MNALMPFYPGRIGWMGGNDIAFRYRIRPDLCTKICPAWPAGKCGVRRIYSGPFG